MNKIKGIDFFKKKILIIHNLMNQLQYIILRLWLSSSNMFHKIHYIFFEIKLNFTCFILQFMYNELK